MRIRPISTCNASTKHRLSLTLKLLAIFFKSNNHTCLFYFHSSCAIFIVSHSFSVVRIPFLFILSFFASLFRWWSCLLSLARSNIKTGALQFVSKRIFRKKEAWIWLASSMTQFLRVIIINKVVSKQSKFRNYFQIWKWFSKIDQKLTGKEMKCS